MDGTNKNIQQLNAREKDILRLLAQSHDAKSAARLLELSTHAVNERLREARRKLEVSSSREAARLLLREEREHTQEIWDDGIGVDAVAQRSQLKSEPRRKGRAMFWSGVSFMFLIAVSAFALGNLGPPLVEQHPIEAVAGSTNLPDNPSERAEEIYAVRVEIRAADELIARPTLLTRAGEISSVSQTGLYDIHFLVASDPNHPTNTRVSANILLGQNGSQRRYSRVASVPYGQSANFELEQAGAVRPPITNVTVTALRTRAEHPD